MHSTARPGEGLFDRSSLMMDLDYILDLETRHIYIIRFRTTEGLVACRLSYIHDEGGPFELRNTRFRKARFDESTEAIPWRRISSFPGDQVFLIPIEKVELAADLHASTITFRDQAPSLSPELMKLRRSLVQSDCVIGVIGSRLVFEEQVTGRDLDLFVSGEHSWQIARRWVEATIASGRATRRNWRSKEHYRIWQALFGLSDAAMDTIRAWQWWKHILIDGLELSFSYTPLSEIREKAVSFSGNLVHTKLRPSAVREGVTAPYPLGDVMDESCNARGGISACWFLRGNQQGVGITGQLCRIDQVDYIWCSSHNDLSYPRGDSA